jgi:hypothetical protein
MHELMTGDGKESLEWMRKAYHEKMKRIAESERRYYEEQSVGNSPTDIIYSPIYRDDITSGEWIEYQFDEMN